jgi:hypothetical protein
VIATGKARIWGPTDIPITYDPPVKDPSEIAVEREANADGPDLFVCWMQKAQRARWSDRAYCGLSRRRPPRCRHRHE